VGDGLGEDIWSFSFLDVSPQKINGRPQAVYIEFWGLENDPKYVERKRNKIEIYRKYEFPLVELVDSDVQNIDDILPRKLLQFKIKVG
jgi:hypothetical protein